VACALQSPPHGMTLRQLPRLALFVVGMMACAGSSDDPAPDPASDPEPPAAPPADPQASVTPPAKPPIVPSFPTVRTRGGPVIANPRVVPIVFAGDQAKDKIDTFTKKMAGSEYWTSVATEYGIGMLSAGDVLELAETPPASILAANLERWLIAKLTGDTPELGAPDANTLYAVYFPSSTKITESNGDSCVAFDAYHGEILAGDGTRVGYAVVSECGLLDELTVATSHEIFEWATDPLPRSRPAWSLLDDAHWAWQQMMIGELSDLCSFLDLDPIRPQEIGFMVQRHWSNKASLAGQFPCAPSGGKPYFQSVPRIEDESLVPDITDVTGSKMIKTKAIRIAPAKSRTVDVLVYSDQPAKQTVDVQASTLAEVNGLPSESGFTFSLNKQRATVGATLELTINAPKNSSFDILVMTTSTDSKTVEYWPVLVTNDDGRDIQAGVPPGSPENRRIHRLR
jgi:hypothetical protein